jgi:hypothetical protein
MPYGGTVLKGLMDSQKPPGPCTPAIIPKPGVIAADALAPPLPPPPPPGPAAAATRSQTMLTVIASMLRRTVTVTALVRVKRVPVGPQCEADWAAATKKRKGKSPPAAALWQGGAVGERVE